MAATPVPGYGPKTVNGVFFLAVLAHIAEITVGRLTVEGAAASGYGDLFILLYLFIAIYAAFVTFKAPNWREQIRVLITCLIVSAVAYFLPLGANWITGKFPNFLGVGVGSILLVFFPTWILFLGFTQEERMSEGLAKFWRFYMLGWVIVLLIVAIPTIQQASKPLAEGGGHAQISPKEVALKVWTGIVDAYYKFTGRARNETKTLINTATGDAYTSKVDANAKAKLGVTMDSLQTTQPTFAVTDPVGVFTRMNAQTLDQPLQITVGCAGKDVDGLPVQKRTVSPATTIEVADQETLDIDCDFAPGAFKAGTATISVSADFGMKTFSYLKSYFMNRDRLRELRTAKIDPFQQYGITDRNPVTIYTNGPISIGMGFSTPPVGIDTTAEEFTGTLGMTIKNEWQGKLKSISSVYVLVPKGFAVTELTGDIGTIKPAKCLDTTIKDWCDDSIANLYVITPSATFAQSLGAQQSATLRMRLRAGQGDYEKLLGTTPIATKYFKAIADYTYSVIQERTISVQGTSTGTTTTNQQVLLAGPPTVTPQSTQASISFTLTAAAGAEIHYCLGTSTASCTKQLITSDAQSTTTHTITLQGLEPNALYAYDIYGYSTYQGCNGKCKVNEDTVQSYTFSTQTP